MLKHTHSGWLKKKKFRLLIVLLILSSVLLLTACSGQLLQVILGSDKTETSISTTESVFTDETTSVSTTEQFVETTPANTSDVGYSADLNFNAPLFAGTEEFPQFLAYNLQGENMDKSLFAQSDLTMINIWGTFCGPCIDEIPALQELSVWAPSVGAQVIGIVGDAYDAEIIDEAIDILTRLDADYLNLVPDDALSIYMSQFQYVPTTVFVNREGMLVGEPIVGSGDLETYQRAILEILGKE